MQEFSTVSASAYDAESLTNQLNAKSADGWDVVSIVSAGSNVVAYLSRESSGEVAAEAAAAGTSEEVAEAEEAADTDSPVEEPSGWAVAAADQASADPTPSDAAVVATAAVAADVATADVEDAEVAAAEVEAAEVEVADVATVDDAAVAAEAESAVPAGWYSDPSSRFELRYWDGAAWTEHVSRAGQQYTDPPVA